MSTIDGGQAIAQPLRRAGVVDPARAARDLPAAPTVADHRRRSFRHELRNFFKGIAFISPWLIGFFVFTFLPVALSFYYSFCDFSLTRAPVLRGLSNYRALVNDPVFWLTLAVTFKYAAIALPAAMMVSLGLALMLNSNIRGQTIYRTIIFLPSLVPLVAAAMVWLCLLNGEMGFVNTAIRRLGELLHQPWAGPRWLTDPSLALITLALMSLW